MFILATLAVIVVIGALFVGNMQQNKRDAIVLPDAAQSTQPELQPDENEPALLEVTRENVQSIVRRLRRPQYYHQTYTITRQMNGAVSETSAELWVADTRVCAVLTTASGEKHILTDGETLYVWYAGDETVRTLAASQDVTMDEHDQQKQHHKRQKAAEEKHRDLPQGRKRGKAGRGRRQRAAGEQRKREEHIEHDE